MHLSRPVRTCGDLLGLGYSSDRLASCVVCRKCAIDRIWLGSRSEVGHLWGRRDACGGCGQCVGVRLI